MPEGHTTHALAERLDRAFSGTVVSVSSPQGRFEDGAALLDTLMLVGASAWGKHLFVQFEGERWLNVHLGLIGKFSVMRHLVDPGPGWVPTRIRRNEVCRTVTSRSRGRSGCAC